jgi:hypothetical protein
MSTYDFLCRCAIITNECFENLRSVWRGLFDLVLSNTLAEKFVLAEVIQVTGKSWCPYSYCGIDRETKKALILDHLRKTLWKERHLKNYSRFYELYHNQLQVLMIRTTQRWRYNCKARPMPQIVFTDSRTKSACIMRVNCDWIATKLRLNLKWSN